MIEVGGKEIPLFVKQTIAEGGIAVRGVRIQVILRLIDSAIIMCMCVACVCLSVCMYVSVCVLSQYTIDRDHKYIVLGA